MTCRIRAFFYAIFFILSVLLVFAFFFFTNSQDKIWKIRKIWAKIQGKFWGFSYELEGKFEENAGLILMNHQSMLDIIALEALYPKNLAWIAKKELGELPIFKYAMKKPKLLCVDRKNPRALISLLKDSQKRLDEGRVLAIFPEGTRARNEKMLKFQSGAKILSEKLKLKVQPILIIDSAKIMDSKKFSLKRGKLKIICLDLLDTSAENWLENSRKLMQERLELERKKQR